MRHWEKKGFLLEYRDGFLIAVHPSESIGYKLKLQMNTFDKVKQEYDVKAKWSCLVLVNVMFCTSLMISVLL